MEYFSKYITNLIFKNYDLALENLKLSKPMFNTVEEKAKYKRLKFELLNISNTDLLVLTNGVSFEVRNGYLNDLAQSIQPLPFTNKINLSCPTPDNYRISTPCIKNNYCNMRAINYIYTNDGDYISRDSDGIVRTINFITTLDDQYNIQDMFKVGEVEDIKIYPCHVMGMEDIRLINEHYFLCTRLDVTPDNRPKMCLCHYDKDKTTSLKVLKNEGTEKNWLPLYDNVSCKLIYSFDPLIIYNLDLDSGDINLFINKKISKYDLTSFRGSAVPISYNDGWLMTIHQVYYHKKRKYYHRFVWLSNNFDTIKFSKAFYFNHIGVEFNLGLEQNDNNIILTYSVNDSQPQLLTIDKTIVNDMLNYL